MSDFENLEREALAIDAAAASENFTEFENVPEPSINENYRPVILKFLNFATGMINSRIPFTAQHFTEQANSAIADSMVKVADIEGLDLNETFGDPNSRFVAWAGLAIAVGLPSVSFYFALKEYQPAKKTADKQEAAQDNQAAPYVQPTEFHA